MLISLLLMAALADTPPGWRLAGSAPGAYAAAVDPDVSHGGGSSARYGSVAPNPSGFGTMMQSFAPDDYIGERVRLSGWVRAADVQGWAGMWMRVDGRTGSAQAFDNMQERPIRGTQDWQRVEIVLDVSEGATNIAFGILVSGAGVVWLDDVRFEVVDRSVPVTDMNTTVRYAPTNLDFED